MYEHDKHDKHVTWTSNRAIAPRPGSWLRACAAPAMLLVLALLGLWACGGVEEDEGFACCNAGRYYACPNKSAALVCDDSSNPDTVCDFQPANNDLCR